VKDDWSVDGASSDVNTRFEGSKYGWSFNTVSIQATLTYNIDIPEDALGEYSFDAVWFDRSGQNRDVSTVTVRVITCGDGHCEGDESHESCPGECPLVEEAAEVQEQEEPGASSEEKKSLLWLFIIVFSIVVLIIVGYIFYYKRVSFSLETKEKSEAGAAEEAKKEEPAPEEEEKK